MEISHRTSRDSWHFGGFERKGRAAYYQLKRHWKLIVFVFVSIILLELVAVSRQYSDDKLTRRPMSFLLHLGKLTGFSGEIKLQQQASNQASGSLTSSMAVNVSTDTFHGLIIKADGSFTERVKQFNVQLSAIRKQISTERKTKNNDSWNAAVLQTKMEFVWGARDDYLELLAKKHRHVLTVALSWLLVADEANANELSKVSPINTRQWTSLTDKYNILVQKYYRWTADDQLCTWIETPGMIKMKYDSIFNRTCERNQSFSAAVPHSLEPLFLNGKPIFKPLYWPNDGNAFPTWFYIDPPPFVFHLHVHQDAVVDDRGDVFSGRSALALYLCRDPYNEPSASLPSNAESLPLYSEVFTLTQMWGTAVFHRMVEVMPRIAVFVDFLLANPDIKIQAPGGDDARFNELLSFFGLDRNRVVHGPVRGKIVYQPRPTGCGFANVQESQLSSKFYRDHISRTVPANQRARNRLILIRRSGSRRFTEQQEIERRLQSVATDFGLKYELFADNPTPSLADTMTMFNAAVLVVGPHGAGLSNIMFSEPGTFVVEGVCNIPDVNLCFQRLAHVLGHRWHGVTSRGGCEGVVDVAAASVDVAARNFLHVWNASKSNSDN